MPEALDNITIVPFDDRYVQHFSRLNRDWLEKYDLIEAADAFHLDTPYESIIAPGGEIFFALDNGRLATFGAKLFGFSEAVLSFHSRTVADTRAYYLTCHDMNELAFNFIFPVTAGHVGPVDNKFGGKPESDTKLFSTGFQQRRLVACAGDDTVMHIFFHGLLRDGLDDLRLTNYRLNAHGIIFEIHDTR